MAAAAPLHGTAAVTNPSNRERLIVSIYRNELPPTLEFPSWVPALAQPLLGPADEEVSPGTRLYALFDYSRPETTLLVTRGGHWYRLGFEADVDSAGNWVCRGCGAPAATGRLLDETGRCWRPPHGQDIASALLARTAMTA
jgi:hypothetical protein